MACPLMAHSGRATRRRWSWTYGEPFKESAKCHRGFIASWPQFGVPAGLFLANLAVLGFSALSGDAFLEWGWRVPFLLNIVLMFIGLYIRLRIFETPAFARLAEQGNISRAPAIEVLRRYPREVLLTAASQFAQTAAFYIFTAFIFTYGTQRLGVSRDFLLGAVITASVVSFFTIPFFGWLSDRIGRKRMYAIGTAALGAFGFVYFALLNTGAPAWIFFAIVISMIPHDMAYGPQAAMIAECFPARLRYSGASLGYHLASVVAAGPAPLIAVALLAQYGSGYAVAGYILYPPSRAWPRRCSCPITQTRIFGHAENQSNPCSPQYILTETRIGYRLLPD